MKLKKNENKIKNNLQWTKLKFKNNMKKIKNRRKLIF